MLINRINGILSSYKESVVGAENNNYELGLSRMIRHTPVEVLRSECQEQIGLMRDVRGTLAGSPLALEIFNEFMDGYIAFQYSHSRHRLREIGVVLGGKE